MAGDSSPLSGARFSGFSESEDPETRSSKLPLVAVPMQWARFHL